VAWKPNCLLTTAYGVLKCRERVRGRRFTMVGQNNEITHLLRRWQGGDADAEAKIFELLLPELRKIAACCFRNERSGHTLQPTALVNEAFLRLAVAKNIEWQDRGHFLAVAARIMRRYLIDHARSRPSIQFLPMEGLPERVLGKHSKLELAVAVDALLDELARECHQRRAVVELKFFLGLTDAEAAEALNLTLHTFQREWHRARKWLFERLTTEPWKALPSKMNA
jgi:RNA polymerase sigma-70 factor, ECF subfamily